MNRRSARALAALLFIVGSLLSFWAASGTAAVAGTTATVAIDGTNLLRLWCSQGVGYKDGFCADGYDPVNRQEHLILDFDRGLENIKYGFQPGSRYVFGDVMHIENISDQTLDVFIRVEQAAGGNLYQVLSVEMTDPNDKNTRHTMFPPQDSSRDPDGTSKIVTMGPGDIASLSFAFDVADDWAARNGTFPNADTRYTLTGAVIVRVGVDTGGDNGSPSDPGDPGDPNDPDDPGMTEEPEQPIHETEEPPLAGPPVSADEEESPLADPGVPLEVPEERPAAGPLPHTGGNNWPYVWAGLLLMMLGGWLYLKTRPDQGARP